MIEINENEYTLKKKQFVCPKCNCKWIERIFSYCANCGEKIKWIKNKRD